MAAIEDRILTSILEGGVLRPALDLGLKEIHFKDPDRQAIFNMMMRWWHAPETSNTLPPFGRIRKKWPSFMPTAVADDNGQELESLIAELKTRAFESDVRGIATYFLEQVDEDARLAVETVQQALQTLDMQDPRAMNPLGLSEVGRLAKEQYIGAKSGVTYGIAWPWKCLTEDTLGKNPGDFIVFYGRMKSMKTWVLLYSAAYDYMVNRKRVLVWSKEMGPEKLGPRMGALLSRVDYHLSKSGALPPKLEAKFLTSMDNLSAPKSAEMLKIEAAEGRSDLLLLSGRNAPKTLDELTKVVDVYRPDVVYLDSFYHLDSARSQGMTERWKRVAALAEDVKSWAEDKRLPVVAVHQANRFGEKTYGNTLADMADADVIAREADLIIRVVMSPKTIQLFEESYEQELALLQKSQRQVRKDRPGIELSKFDPRRFSPEMLERVKEKIESRKGAELALVMGGNREGILEAFTIRAVPAYDFQLINDSPSMKDIKEWVSEDNKKEGDAPPAAAKKGKNKKKDGGLETAQKFADSLARTTGQHWGKNGGGS